jgi:pilus assembly protein CpaB
VQQAAPKPEPQLRVLAAARSLPAGHLIQPDDLVWTQWDKEDQRLPSYFAEGDHRPDELHGAVVRRGIEQGSPLVQGRLVKPGEQGFLAAVMEPGMRAVAVRINEVTGIAGLVFPGDRVDLLLTQRVQRPNDPERAERFASETVLTNLRVLAIDQSTNDQTATPQTAEIVTVEVTPKQAELVTLMSELGQLSLSLRSLQGEEEREMLAGLPEAVAQVATGVQLHGTTGYGQLSGQAAGAVKALVGGAPQPRLDLGGPLGAGLSDAATGKALLPAELEAALAGLNPAERAAALRSLNANPYSWDSDVSLLLPDPADPEASVRKVQVIRGAEAAVVPFER